MESVGSQTPKVSIILPVRNEARYIRGVLQQIHEQDFPTHELEVIVVDGMSSDNTKIVAAEFKEQFRSFRIIENPKKLSSSARNLGFQASNGNYIMFIDGHCHISSKKLIADMVSLFEQDGADVLCRPQPLTLGPQSYFQQAVALARASFLGHNLDSNIYSQKEGVVQAASSGAMYRRTVFEKMGLFDENFDACEDVEFNTRVDKAGIKAVISPKLTIEYAARHDFTGLFRQLFRYGYGRWRLFLKHPSTLGLSTFVGVMFFVGLLFLPFSFLISRDLGLVIASVYVLYLLINLGVSLSIASKHRWSLIFVLPVVLFAIPLAFGSGFLVNVFKFKNAR